MLPRMKLKLRKITQKQTNKQQRETHRENKQACSTGTLTSGLWTK